jgi:hypothetical protein
MRKVECTRIKYEWEGGNRKTIETKVDGLFHQWGSEYEEFETGAGNYSVALIELDDGTIEAFLPQLIKFITAA